MAQQRKMLEPNTSKSIAENAPLVSVDICLVYQGEILLGIRNNQPLKGEWLTPGGRVFKNEPWQECIRRIVVAGRARVHDADKRYHLSVNESIYHGKEVDHALENPGDTPLELIEAQVGRYLGEDDIVRFEDKYGRVQ